MHKLILIEVYKVHSHNCMMVETPPIKLNIVKTDYKLFHFTNGMCCWGHFEENGV